MTPVKFSLFSTGYCTSLEKFVRKEGSYFKTCRFPATFALIEHPLEGPILYDTGYSHRFFEVCRQLPYSLYPLITPVSLEKSAKEILSSEIKKIIISHFHADHICGLKDFPRAEFLYLKDAWEHVKDLSGSKAVKQAFIPELIPDDFEQRSTQLSLADSTSLTGLNPFEHGIDLLGDGSLIGIPLPGHANGQMGLYFNSEEHGPIFLIADACWQMLQIEKQERPHWITSFLLDDNIAFEETLNKLHHLSKNEPNLFIIPTHCEQTYEEIKCFQSC